MYCRYLKDFVVNRRRQQTSVLWLFYHHRYGQWYVGSDKLAFMYFSLLSLSLLGSAAE